MRSCSTNGVEQTITKLGSPCPVLGATADPLLAFHAAQQRGHGGPESLRFFCIFLLAHGQIMAMADLPRRSRLLW
jgi:hypothetical protein